MAARLKACKMPAVTGGWHFKVVAALCWSWSVAAMAVLPSSRDLHAGLKEGHFVLQVSIHHGPRSTRCWTRQTHQRRCPGPALCQSIEQQSARGVGRGYISVRIEPEFHSTQGGRTVDQGAAQQDCGPFWRSTRGYRASSHLSRRSHQRKLERETAQVAVKIFGDDLARLRDRDKVVAALGKVPGIVDVQFKRRRHADHRLEVLPQALSATGLKVQDVLDTIESAYAGKIVGQTSKALAPSGGPCSCR